MHDLFVYGPRAIRVNTTFVSLPTKEKKTLNNVQFDYSVPF